MEEGSWKRKRGHRHYRGPRTITHLRKVSRKRRDTTHLRKVGEGSWKRKRGHRHYRGPRTIAHLRKVGRGSWKRKRAYRPYRWSRADCAPPEGETETRKFRAPSEGGRRQLETETRVQALQRAPRDCAPSEGEQKTWENHSPSEGEQKTQRYHTPSEGGRRQLETKTRAQALQRASGPRADCAPSGLLPKE